MRINDYLAATGQTKAGFARIAEMPQRTVDAIASKDGSCRVEQARKLIDGSKRAPALKRDGSKRADWHITLDDLADGAIEYLAREFY